MLRSIRRPAKRPSKPGTRGALTRSSTCSSTWTAAARPKRAVSAAGSASWFVIVPVAVASVSVPADAFESVIVSVSLPSLCSSSRTATSMLPLELPAPIVSVPPVDV